MGFCFLALWFSLLRLYYLVFWRRWSWAGWEAYSSLGRWLGMLGVPGCVATDHG